MPAMKIEQGGRATVTRDGSLYKREQDGGSVHRWLKRTPDGWQSVSESRGRRLERIYRHPERHDTFRRFPRLSKRNKKPIKSFFDIPQKRISETLTAQWLVDGLIPENQLILITGQPGSFKSFLATYLAATVSKGHKFLSRKTRQTMVLILDRDNPEQIVAQRLQLLNASGNNYLRIWGNQTHEQPPEIDDPRLEQFARNHRLLISFDCLVRFHNVEENAAKDMTPVMAKLRKLVTAGATVIVLHHDNKDGKNRAKYRGSSEIHASVDVAFHLSMKRGSNPRLITLDCFKHRGMEEFKLTMRPDFNCPRIRQDR